MHQGFSLCILLEQRRRLDSNDRFPITFTAFVYVWFVMTRQSISGRNSEALNIAIGQCLIAGAVGVWFFTSNSEKGSRRVARLFWGKEARLHGRFSNARFRTNPPFVVGKRLGDCAVHLVMTSVVCSDYTWIWVRDANVTSLAIGSLTVRRNVFRYHLGSLAFGSFIIAVIQLIRAILKYYEQLGCKRRLTSSEIRVHVNLTADVFPASPRHSFCFREWGSKQNKQRTKCWSWSWRFVVSASGALRSAFGAQMFRCFVHAFLKLLPGVLAFVPQASGAPWDAYYLYFVTRWNSWTSLLPAASGQGLQLLSAKQICIALQVPWFRYAEIEEHQSWGTPISRLHWWAQISAHQPRKPSSWFWEMHSDLVLSLSSEWHVWRRQHQIFHQLFGVLWGDLASVID